MEAAAQAIFTQEELVRMEIRNFVNEGLQNVQNNELFDADEVFDELENRYKDAEV